MDVQRVMSVYVGSTVREVVDYANKHLVRKDDIVTIMERGAQIYLIYYKPIAVQ
jgi:hypothetical protein